MDERRSQRPPTWGCRRRRVSVADFFSDPCHGGGIAEAPIRGEARGGSTANPLIVWIGLWPDGRGGARGARWKASTCVTLMAFAEAACELIQEEKVPPSDVDAERLRARIAGVHAGHGDRAELVARAVADAASGLAGPQGGCP